MALALCRKKFSIGCQDHGFFSTNCQPTCHFSTNCQTDFCLQYASGSRTTSFKKYKKTLCRDVFFAPFFSTMCRFFSSMRCPGFFSVFQKKNSFFASGGRGHIVESFQLLSIPFMFISFPFMFISFPFMFISFPFMFISFPFMSFQTTNIKNTQNNANNNTNHNINHRNHNQ